MGISDASEVDDPADRAFDNSAVVIAGVGRRVGAGLIDSFAISVVAFLALRAADSIGLPRPGWVAFIAAEWLLVVGPIAVTGRPLGAIVARTVVVSADDYSVAGWPASVSRWLVAHLPVLVVAVVVVIGIADAAALALLQLAALAVIYGGILFNPKSQGLHDRVAGTLVVLRHGDADTWLVRQRRNMSLDPHQIAVEERKRELMALGAKELTRFVPTTGYESCPAELATFHDGFRVSVMISPGLPNGSDDVLFAVSAHGDERVFHPVHLEGFAVRGGASVDELTDEEWGYLS